MGTYCGDIITQLPDFNRAKEGSPELMEFFLRVVFLDFGLILKIADPNAAFVVQTESDIAGIGFVEECFRVPSLPDIRCRPELLRRKVWVSNLDDWRPTRIA